MHEDHRNRVKKKYERHDLDVFEEHQVLEMMLFYTIPRKDTNEIAHRLIDRFGSFVQVLDAPLSELESVEGIGHQSALYLKFIRSVGRYYNICAAKPKDTPKTLEECENYLAARLEGKQNEEVHMLCLDSKHDVIGCVALGEGSVCSVNVPIRKIVNQALSMNAVAVILAHNHPGGFALPSKDDVMVTEHLRNVLQQTGIELLDHIIVADQDYVSLYYSKLYHPRGEGK